MNTMRSVLVVALAILWASTARADVPRRTFKALGDVAYMPQEGKASCGKDARDLIKGAVAAARTITVTAKEIRMNHGDAWTIVKEDGGGVYAGKSIPAPTEAFPHRTITMLMGVLVSGKDATFVFARSADSDGASCTDVYRVSIE